MVRVAIIGFGGYGGVLTGTLLAESSEGLCRIVAAADGRLGELGDQTDKLTAAGVRLYDDAIKMLDDVADECDAVYIATGIGSHTELTRQAVRRGLHVHLEKPPAAVVQDVDAMIAAVDEAGVLCNVGFQYPWSAVPQWLCERIASGELGRVETLSCYAGWPRRAKYYARNNWAGKLRVGESWILDGPATNALSHQLTNLLLLAGASEGRFASPTRVHAELYAAGPVDSHDTAAIRFETDTGPTALLAVSHCSDSNFGPILTIECEKARVEMHVHRQATIHCADGRSETSPEPDNATVEMIRGFLQAVDAGDAAAIRCPLAETRKMVLALDGAHESSGRIHRIAGGGAQRVDTDHTEGARTIVAGMDDLLPRSAGEGKLFSELDDAPDWAVATEPFEMDRYTQFPQRFDANAAGES